MSDLTDRLGKMLNDKDFGGSPVAMNSFLKDQRQEARERIMTLEAENAKLRGALHLLSIATSTGDGLSPSQVVDVNAAINDVLDTK